MKDIPKGVEFKIVDESEIPTDRTFRNAWNYDLKEDLSKSKEIWKEKLRADRKPLLEELDVEYMKALELGDDVSQADIVARKQKLRDVTGIVDSAKTISGIKKVKITSKGFTIFPKGNSSCQFHESTVLTTNCGVPALYSTPIQRTVSVGIAIPAAAEISFVTTTPV